MEQMNNSSTNASPDHKMSLNSSTNGYDKGFDVSEAILLAKVDPEAQLEPPPVLLSFNGTPVFTLGNISLIIGKAKSMKTFFLCLVIARILGAAVEGIEILDIKKVVFFDTEQSRYDVKRFIDRISRLVGVKIKIDVFCLRPYSPSERKIIIDAYLQENKDVSISFIDGVRDLVTDINSPDQATEIATWLMKLTDELNIHICTVLHQNKGDNNARGHLGTEMVNKSETIVTITKDKTEGFSIVDADETRAKAFKPFAIMIDDDGLPRIYEEWHIKDVIKPEETPDLHDEGFHREILCNAFGIDVKPNYSTLQENLKVALQGKGLDMGKNRLRDYINYYKTQEFIKQEGISRTKNAYYLYVPKAI